MAPTAKPPENTPYNAANPADDSSIFRAALRREMIAARVALPAAEHVRRSALIEAHLERELAPRAPATIGFCAPIRAEFDARPLMARLAAAGWAVCMPVVVAPAAPMAFRRWSPQTPMAVDAHGIAIPADPAACAAPSLILLPLVAFDARGYRLGYGGGYFDRTLAALVPHPQTLGVGFALAGVADTRPGRHDIPLDAVVTEDGVQRFARA